MPYINNPNILNDAGQVPLIEAIDCINITAQDAAVNGDYIFRGLLNHTSIDRQTTPPPLIPLMAKCIYTLVPEILKFNDTIVNFKGTMLSEYQDYLHDYLNTCDDYNTALKNAGFDSNKAITDVYTALFSAGADVNDVANEGDNILMNIYQKSSGLKADWFINTVIEKGYNFNWKYRNPNNNSTALHENIKCRHI